VRVDLAPWAKSRIELEVRQARKSHARGMEYLRQITMEGEG
jgi:hypothetical protein